MDDSSCNSIDSSLQIEQAAGTTLTAFVTATGNFTRTFSWTINKSVTPTSWNLFTGDTGISTYTIAVTKSSGVDTAFVEGQVCVTNAGAIATENLVIVANLTMPPSNTVIASVNVDVSGHPVLQPGETFCYNYRIDIPTASIVPGANYKVTADITITNHSGHLGTPFGPSPSATTTLPASPTLINDVIHVDDTNGMSSFTFSTSGTQTYNQQFTCGNAGTNTNTATILETGQQSSASVTVTCFSLAVSKTANTSFTRTFNWNINKFADQTLLTLATTEQFTVNYEIDVNATFTDSNFAVNGSITVHNPAPITATIKSLSDIVDGNMVDVACVDSFPITIPAGGDLVCTYTTSLPDASTHTNTATATLQNFIYNPDGTKFIDGTTDFSGTALVDFTNAMITKIDNCVDVSDTAAGMLGTVCFGVDTLPKAFIYSRIIGPFSPCGDYTVTNTASFITNITGATGSSSWTVNIHVPCQGCTLTIGYWKTHTGFGPQPDKVTPLLPIWLGTPNGSKSIYVQTASQAVDILNMNVLGTPENGITKLYAQLLAAKLNIANGADPSAVASTISAADAFLATHNWLDWAGLSRAQKNLVLSWVTILDNYNTGIIGPGHCTEQ